MTPIELNELLARVESGHLDSLSTDQVLQLEAHLNRDAAAARRIGVAAVPPMSPAPGMPTLPSDAMWRMVWSQIAAAGDLAVHQPSAARPAALLRLPHAWPGLRRIRPFAAAAACVLGVGIWSWLTPAQAERLRLNADTQISQLEVDENWSSFVLTDNGDQDFTIIWVVEDHG